MTADGCEDEQLDEIIKHAAAMADG